MADFCRQCSVEIFGRDFGDLANLGDGESLKWNEGWTALCEDCGPCVVKEDGTCISQGCFKHHGKNVNSKEDLARYLTELDKGYTS